MKSRLTLPLLIALTVAGYGLGIHGSVPDVPTGQWMPGASLAQPREGAVSVALDDGRVLILGGRTAEGPVATVEALNADGSLTVLPSMFAPRVGHTAVVLADGSVLVAGGTSLFATDQGTVEAPTASAEIFTPTGNMWSATSPLGVARSGHTATALADGRVFIAGGTSEQGPLDSMEVFEPQEGTFRAAGVLSAARAEAAAAVAGKTRVLVVGGRNADGVLATADLVDVESGAVAQLMLTSPRVGASATKLIDGTVFVAGGNDGQNDLATAEVIDPASGVSLPAGSMAQARSGHQATLLDHNAAVLIVGGTNNGGTVTTAETFVPWTNQFAATNSSNTPRTSAIVSSTSTDGVAMLAGGKAISGALVAGVEFYGFATVKTDKDDYPPGTFVIITGSGWQPGETVNLVLHETGPGAEPDLPLLATADAHGRIFNDWFATNESDIGRRFYLTAVGAGATAQTTFTDALNTNTQLTSSANPAAPGQSITYTATVTQNSGGAPVTKGTVQFFVGGQNCTGNTGTLIQSVAVDGSTGQATTSTSFATSGDRTIRACYDDATKEFGGSSAAITQQVNAANASISGTVYNDANGNGVLDAGEVGISGLAVSLSGTSTASTTTNAGGAYTFSGLVAGNYSVDYTVPPNFANTGIKPRTIVLAASATSTGNNFFAAPRYTVTFQQSGLDGDTASATIVTVNGTPYSAASLPALTFTAGQSVTYSYAVAVTSTVTGKRYALTTPQPAPSSPFNVSGNVTITGTYKKQFQVTFTQSGIGGDSTGTIVTVAGAAQTVLPFSTDWLDSGASLSYTYEPLVASTLSGKRYVRIAPDPSPATPISVTSPLTVTGTYKTQYELTFAQSGIGSDGTGTIVTVNATAKDALPFSDWFDSGAPIDYAYAPTVASTVTGKRYALTTPDPSPTSPFNVAGPATITGTYKTQYEVTFAQSGIGSDSTATIVTVNASAKTTLPFSDWYDNGAEMGYTYAPTVATSVTGKRYALTTPAPSPNSPFNVTGPVTITGTYKTQFEVTFAQTGIGSPDIGTNPVVKVAGADKTKAALPFSSWYDQNTTVAYSFYTPISTAPVISDKQYELANSASLPSSPHTVTAAITITGEYATATYSILYHQPIDQSAGGGVVVNTGKNGRVIPVKIEFFKNGAPVQSGTVLMKVNGSTCSGGAPTDLVTEYSDAGSSNGNTNVFRWSAGSPGFWIYNLDTRALGLQTNACYRLDVYLNATTGSNAVLLSSSTFALFKPVK